MYIHEYILYRECFVEVIWEISYCVYSIMGLPWRSSVTGWPHSMQQLKLWPEQTCRQQLRSWAERLPNDDTLAHPWRPGMGSFCIRLPAPGPARAIPYFMKTLAYAIYTTHFLHFFGRFHLSSYSAGAPALLALHGSMNSIFPKCLWIKTQQV